MSKVSKRAVARHACLACREKKVKCDGEVPGPSGERQLELKTQRCTNCKAANIQCIFVRSQRGGRRKKDVDGQPLSSAIHQTQQLEINGSEAKIIDGGFSYTQKNAQPSGPPLSTQSIISHSSANGCPPTDYYRHGSNSAPSDNDQPKSYLHQQQPFQIDSQQHQSQSFHWNVVPNFNHTDSVNAPSAPNDPQSYQSQTQPFQSHPQSFHTSVPILPYSTYPQPSYPLLQATQINVFDRTVLGDHNRYIENNSLPKTSTVEKFIYFTDDDLKKLDLPDWKTTCCLIDLYYRYIHPSRPFLPSKHRLVYQIQIRQDASLLHAMFSCSARFASTRDVPDPELRDPQHWYFLAEKYWDLLDLETSLQALVLLMGALGPVGYVEQAIEGEERFKKKLHVCDFYQTLIIKDWQSFASCATKKQVIRYEDMLRTVWGSWKLNVFLRINRGFPFHRLSADLVEFLEEIPFPSSDTAFNANLSIFDVDDTSAIAKLKYKSWKEIKQDLISAETDSSKYDEFTDAQLIIISTKTMEEVMDTISAVKLNSSTVSEFNERIKLIENITNSSPYHVSNIKTRMIVLNISKIFALLIVNVAKLVSNVSQCARILLIKPHETNSNSNPDDVFNSLYESKLETINEAIMTTTPQQLYHYFTAFKAALDATGYIGLGLGSIPEDSGSAIPCTVIGGPLNFQPACEISSLETNENWWLDAIPEPGKTMSAQAEAYDGVVDAWLQYPIFSVVVIANALTVLSSSAVLTKMLRIVEVSTGNGTLDIEVVAKNGKRVIPISLPHDEFRDCVKSFNIVDLKKRIRLCSKFIQSHGRFWPYVESISAQAEHIINYVDDVISSMG